MIGAPAGSAAGPDDWMADRLFAQRIVQLSGPLGAATSNHVAAQLMTFDALGDDPGELHITSPGGDVAAALALVDVIDLLGVPVRATAFGRVHGPALAVLAGCADRTVSGHASLRLVGTRVDLWGDAGQLVRQATAQRAEWDALCAHIARASGQGLDRVLADAEAGRFFTAEEAVAYGIADRIGGAGASISGLPSRAIGFRPDIRR